MTGCTVSRKLREKNSQYVLKRKWSTMLNVTETGRRKMSTEKGFRLAT